MAPQPDVLVMYYCSVSGENEELLGVDESPITDIHWVAVDVVDNKVCLSLFTEPGTKVMCKTNVDERP